jgi:hypothetical protein
MKYLGLREQLRIERRKNDALRSELLRAKANTDYIAMMTGVDVDETAEDEPKEVEHDE